MKTLPEIVKQSRFSTLTIASTTAFILIGMFIAIGVYIENAGFTYNTVHSLTGLLVTIMFGVIVVYGYLFVPFFLDWLEKKLGLNTKNKKLKK